MWREKRGGRGREGKERQVIKGVGREEGDRRGRKAGNGGREWRPRAGVERGSREWKEGGRREWREGAKGDRECRGVEWGGGRGQ